MTLVVAPAADTGKQLAQTRELRTFEELMTKLNSGVPLDARMSDDSLEAQEAFARRHTAFNEIHLSDKFASEFARLSRVVSIDKTSDHRVFKGEVDLLDSKGEPLKVVSQKKPLSAKSRRLPTGRSQPKVPSLQGALAGNNY